MGMRDEGHKLGCCGRHLQTWGGGGGHTIAHVTLLAFV